MSEAIPSVRPTPLVEFYQRERPASYPRAERRPLPVQVREAIEEQILTGALREGDQIVEYQIARQMGISQTPVREALRTLERDGLVVTLPHRGTFVRRVTRREAAERYSLGMELEAFAARLALPRLTADDFRRLEALIDEMAAAADLARRELLAPHGQLVDVNEVAFARTVELNVAFHRYLVERAEHELLLKAWLSVNPLNWRFVTYTRLLNPDPVELAERHRALLEIYRTGDEARAAAAIRQHIGEVAVRVLPNIPDDPARPLGDEVTFF
jgi:DNA-binding GntR family transcriptional regulator